MPQHDAQCGSLLPLLPSLGGRQGGGHPPKRTLLRRIGRAQCPAFFSVFFAQILLSSHLLPNNDEKTAF